MINEKSAGCIIIDNDKVLLVQQSSGNWGFPKGHLEKGESETEAAIRETKEEIGINIFKKNLKFAGFYYNNIDSKVYCYTYFHISIYEGNPTIAEPEKCSALEWFDINNLPEKIIPDRKTAIENFMSNIYFGEIGWNSNTTC